MILSKKRKLKMNSIVFILLIMLKKLYMKILIKVYLVNILVILIHLNFIK